MEIFWGAMALSGIGAILARSFSAKWRGRRIIEILQGTPAKLRRYQSPMKNKKDTEHFLWGCEYLDEEEASCHFLVLGSTGSGKTLNILLLMKSVAAKMREKGSGVRALAYDSKSDLLSSIKGLGFEDEDILVLNPFDERRCAWEMASDITTPAHADDMAALLAPADKGASNPYFSDTAQDLLAGMIVAFQQNAPGRWTLRDLIVAARDSDKIQAILASCRYTEDLLSQFRVQETSENVCSTLATKLGKFSSIAASWETADRRFTISEWLAGQSIIILGNSPKAKKPIRVLNQLLFSSIAKEIIDLPGREKAKHWFFLDELRELGNLDMLGDMMTVGRSKGASMVLGFQDINGMFAEYGKEKALELVGQAGNFALLRINGTQPETQKWASQVTGQLRYRERKQTTTSGGEHGSTSVGYELRTDDFFIPSYFSQMIHKTSLEKGMLGVYYTKGELYEQPISGEVLFTDQGEGSRPNRIPVPVDDYPDHEPLRGSLLLEPWEKSDWERLGMKFPQDDQNEGTATWKSSEVNKRLLKGAS